MVDTSLAEELTGIKIEDGEVKEVEEKTVAEKVVEDAVPVDELEQEQKETEQDDDTGGRRTPEGGRIRKTPGLGRDRDTSSKDDKDKDVDKERDEKDVKTQKDKETRKDRIEELKEQEKEIERNIEKVEGKDKVLIQDKTLTQVKGTGKDQKKVGKFRAFKKVSGEEAKDILEEQKTDVSKIREAEQDEDKVARRTEEGDVVVEEKREIPTELSESEQEIIDTRQQFLRDPTGLRRQASETIVETDEFEFSTRDIFDPVTEFEDQRKQVEEQQVLTKKQIDTLKKQFEEDEKLIVGGEEQTVEKTKEQLENQLDQLQNLERKLETQQDLKQAREDREKLEQERIKENEFLREYKRLAEEETIDVEREFLEKQAQSALKAGVELAQPEKGIPGFVSEQVFEPVQEKIISEGGEFLQEAGLTKTQIDISGESSEIFGETLPSMTVLQQRASETATQTFDVVDSVVKVAEITGDVLPFSEKERKEYVTKTEEIATDVLGEEEKGLQDIASELTGAAVKGTVEGDPGIAAGLITEQAIERTPGAETAITEAFAEEAVEKTTEPQTLGLITAQTQEQPFQTLEEGVKGSARLKRMVAQKPVEIGVGETLPDITLDLAIPDPIPGSAVVATPTVMQQTQVQPQVQTQTQETVTPLSQRLGSDIKLGGTRKGTTSISPSIPDTNPQIVPQTTPVVTEQVQVQSQADVGASTIVPTIQPLTQETSIQDTEIKSDIIKSARPVSQTISQATPQVQSIPQAQTQAIAQPQIQAQAQPVAQTQVIAQAQPQIQPQVQPQIQPQVQAQIEPEIDEETEDEEDFFRTITRSQPTFEFAPSLAALGRGQTQEVSLEQLEEETFTGLELREIPEL